MLLMEFAECMGRTQTDLTEKLGSRGKKSELIWKALEPNINHFGRPEDSRRSVQYPKASIRMIFENW